MNETVLMAKVQAEIAKLRNQRYRYISMLSGSVLYYAINTPEAQVLYAPDIRPVWLQPSRGLLVNPPAGNWH